MALHESDKEQIDLIKSWWNEYGKTMLFTVIVVLLAGSGWRYWQHEQLENKTNAAVLYQRLQLTIQQKNTKNAAKITTQLQTQYPGTIYATVATLLAAKESVVANRLTQASESLQWVVGHTHSQYLTAIARMRLARIYLAKRDTNAAIKLLQKVKLAGMNGQKQLILGDAYLAQGKVNNAKQAYQLALKAMSVKQKGMSALHDDFYSQIALKLHSIPTT